MKFDLSGKIALVTGAGSGIGRAITEALAAQGATVHLIDIDQNALQQTVAAIRESNGQAEAHACNITDGPAVKSLADGIGHKKGIDILVNNAGIAHIGNIEQTSDTDLDRLYEVNIKGAYHCTRAVIPHMKKNGGVILNLASVAATVGVADRFAYSMTKGAILTMTYSLAKDYIQYNIRCNSISPARVHTPFVDGYLERTYPDNKEEMFDKLSKTQPIGRMGTPNEVAHLALYLCSDEAAFITGTDFPIDGGFIRLNG